MITFKTISYFRKRLSSMMKVKKGVYANVEEELIREFKNKPIEQIRIVSIQPLFWRSEI